MEEDHDENNTSRLLFDTNLVLVCEKKQNMEDKIATSQPRCSKTQNDCMAYYHNHMGRNPKSWARAKNKCGGRFPPPTK
ncbi:hypothetical protein EJB05_08574, partial [Eragrostis curvula]